MPYPCPTQLLFTNVNSSCPHSAAKRKKRSPQLPSNRAKIELLPLRTLWGVQSSALILRRPPPIRRRYTRRRPPTLAVTTEYYRTHLIPLGLLVTLHLGPSSTF